MDKATLTAAINVLDLEPEAGAAVARLGEDDLRQIDQAILSALDHRWHKAGFIVSGVMIAAPDEHEDLPEVLYELRIRALAAAARIESKGDPQMMKTFEIRLPAGQQAH